MSRFLLPLVGVVALFTTSFGTALAAPAQQAGDCTFVLGFKTLHDLIPNIAGNCVTDEQHAANGDGLQFTENGLMVWRKADNFTAFTDGFRTWINGPFGLQERLNTQRFDWEKTFSKVTETQVISFVPPTTTSRQISGNCFAPSAAATRSDAFRCMSENEIFDPCFTIPGNAGAVVCVENPLDPSTFVTINLTEPLPEPANQPTHPWFLQLADQTQCGFFTGATGGVNGERVNYGCTDGWVVVGFPQPDTVWTANEVFLAPMSTSVEKSATVQVAIAFE